MQPIVAHALGASGCSCSSPTRAVADLCLIVANLGLRLASSGSAPQGAVLEASVTKPLMAVAGFSLLHRSLHVDFSCPRAALRRLARFRGPMFGCNTGNIVLHYTDIFSADYLLRAQRRLGSTQSANLAANVKDRIYPR